MRQHITALTELTKNNDINGSSWIERRYALLKDIPVLTDQNQKLRKEVEKYDSTLT